MEIFVTVILIALLLLVVAALVVTLQLSATNRQRVRYLEVALERAKTQAVRKETAILRQSGEMARLMERCADLEAELAGVRDQHAALLTSYRALRYCYAAQEQVMREKGMLRSQPGDPRVVGADTPRQ